MISFDVIIIGGGPAGMFAAIHMGRDKNVLLLEKNKRPGKKLLLAGSGRCNLTHTGDIEHFLEHYGANRRFLRNALKSFSNEDLIRFFNKRRLPTNIDKNGKVFPASGNAAAVLGILLEECRKQNVLIHTDEAVSKIAIKDIRDPGFRIVTRAGEYNCRYLVIATGGKSYPGSGSTGDGFDFARSVGHTVIDPKPALAPVYIKDYGFAAVSGVSLSNRRVYLYRGGKKIKEHRGDIGFTHKGLSGPGILDFSRYMERNDTLRLAVAAQKEEDFTRSFMETAEKEGKISIKRFLKKFDIPVGLTGIILRQLDIHQDEKLANITRQKRARLIEFFCRYPFVIEKVGGFDVAMVTRGGVSLKEVSSKTMESGLIPGLYFAGEVLDIDGDTGGYNIQAAFSTGYLAARAISGECRHQKRHS
jgi:predicted Rossmann fold flavoprotein